MENYLVVLLLSVFVLLGAVYVHQVEQKNVKIKDELLQHGNEIKKGKVELGSTRKELSQVKVELESTKKEAQVELGSTRKELTQVQVELELTRKELKQLKVELNTTTRQSLILIIESKGEDIDLWSLIIKMLADEIWVFKDIAPMKTVLFTKKPGFYATLTSHTELGEIQTIKFDKKITDVTNNYNTNTGVFKVPIDGLYHISCTTFSKSGMLHAEVMQNDQVIGRNFGISSHVSAAINIVISCHQGDDIYVRHGSGQGTQNIHGFGYSTFSGFLMY